MTPRQGAALAKLEARTGSTATSARYNSAGNVSLSWTDERGSWRVLVCPRGFVWSTQRKHDAGHFTIAAPEDCLPAGL
ncbi:hypothetical protein SEA_STEVIEBAY_79 [Arthrobacter phage StevieBAY]|uniref:Uncharacterized protein n=1 Tax=Arthrobacter phage StevieBAY TaxID=2725609 RepID=A0A6M3T5H7_9CAUD|nr:hypothetical protein SEA_STEVIEBAY_79 [Arthrobacter phage StevieBAY]